MISPALEIKKIAIFRALQLGDLLCAIPAIRSLRKVYPEAHITLIGLPGSRELALRYPKYFNAFIPFPGYPGLPEQNFDQDKFNAFIKLVQLLHFDLVLQMQGNGTIVNELIKSFGAKSIAGFCPEDQHHRPNEYLMRYPNYGHEINRHLLFMGFLGIPPVGTAIDFPLYDKDYLDFSQLGLPVQPRRYVCIHPGSRGSWRQWSPLYFATLGDYCLKMGYSVVITGTSEEVSIAENVAELMKGEPIITAGKTSIGAVGILIDQAFALIANCTGVSHLATALETQSVIVSMDGESERWAPLNQQLHRTIDWTKSPDYNVVFKELTALFFRL